MEVGIIGLPYVGKTMLFSALTSGARSGGAAGAGGGAGRPNVAVAHIPDPRLALISSFIPTKKITHAALNLVDIAGLQPGGQSAKFLDHIRQVDAVCHVVPCFDDPSAEGGRNPPRDIDAIESELILADMAVVEGALPRAERSAKSKDPKAVARFAAMQRVMPVLGEGRPIRAMLGAGEITDEPEIAAIRELGLVSAKKVLYVANVGENDVKGESASARQVADRARVDGMESVALCAKIEAELVELAEADRAEMLVALGLTEPALPALARALYRLLGLQSFYTAGEKEVRAWTVRAGATAPEAAGAIHSDIQRGFIRAEVYKVDDLAALKCEKAIKEAGKMRSEGKSYVMQDGDVVHFLFNV